MIALEDVASTQDMARTAADTGAGDGTVITARRQTLGRGRRGRPWIALTGNLSASLILRLNLPPVRLPELSLLAGLALAEALIALGIPVRDIALKWPNDVLLAGKKLAGILIETSSPGVRDETVAILGLGVNLQAAPDGLTPPAIALAAYGANIAVDAMLKEFITSFAELRQLWHIEGFAPIRSAWLKQAYGLGEMMLISNDSGSQPARYIDIAPDGRLLVDRGRGIEALAVAEWSLRAGSSG